MASREARDGFTIRQGRSRVTGTLRNGLARDTALVILCTTLVARRRRLPHFTHLGVLRDAKRLACSGTGGEYVPDPAHFPTHLVTLLVLQEDDR